MPNTQSVTLQHMELGLSTCVDHIYGLLLLSGPTSGENPFNARRPGPQDVTCFSAHRLRRKGMHVEYWYVLKVCKICYQGYISAVVRVYRQDHRPLRRRQMGTTSIKELILAANADLK